MRLTFGPSRGRTLDPGYPRSCESIRPDAPRFRRRAYRTADAALFGRGSTAMDGRLVSVLDRRAGGKREESGGGEEGDNECFHNGIVV